MLPSSFLLWVASSFFARFLLLSCFPCAVLLVRICICIRIIVLTAGCTFAPPTSSCPKKIAQAQIINACIEVDTLFISFSLFSFFFFRHFRNLAAKLAEAGGDGTFLVRNRPNDGEWVLSVTYKGTRKQGVPFYHIGFAHKFYNLPFCA